MKSSKKYPGAKGVITVRDRIPRTGRLVDTTIVDPGKVSVSGLKDSGARQVSATGGLREPEPVENGRFDLIPAECLQRIFDATTANSWDDALVNLSFWISNSGVGFGAARFTRFLLEGAGSLSEGLRLLAIHYARGAVKYEPRNWEKGLETGRTVSSLFRHVGKLRVGMTDEDHRSAAAWNTIALMWHVPRLLDGRLPKELDTYGLVKS